MAKNVSKFGILALFIALVMVFSMILIGCGEKDCVLCNGTGKCNWCKGTGRVTNTSGTVTVDCGQCWTTGSGKCKECHGTGKQR